MDRFNEFTFIGLGAAGGNIADLATENGFYNSIAINYSQSDLDSLEHIPLERKHKILGSDGLGHNREEAARFLMKNPDSTRDFLKKYLSPQNETITLITFSTGGGSGSGLAPIVYELIKSTNPSQTIVLMPILPDLSEPLFAQYNSLMLFHAIQPFDCAVLPLDNQQMKLKHLPSKSELFTKINEKCVKILKNIAKSTQIHSKISNFDKRDLMTLFQTKGYLTLSMLEFSPSKNHYLLNEIQSSWTNGIFTPVSKEMILKAGLIVRGIPRHIPSLSTKQLFSCFQNQPFDLFEGNYESNDENATAQIITVLAGLAPIQKRLKAIQQMVQTKSNQVAKATKDNKLDIDLNNLSFVDQLKFNRQKKKETETKNQPSISSILKKYME